MDDGFYARGIDEFSKNPNSGLSYAWYWKRWQGPAGDLRQAQTQVAAAAEHGYGVEWRVAGPQAAELLQQAFDSLKIPIEVVYEPP
jgi:hypothetical protein